MAHTRPLHAPPNPDGPVEGDGISYRGIVWFVVILTVTTLFCQALVWVMFGWQDRRFARNDPPRPVLAAPSGAQPPGPNLIYMGKPPALGEPATLQHFRDAEGAALTTYGWVDRNTGAVRIPIDRAKTLLLERGLPVRSATPSAPATGGAPAAPGGRGNR